MNSADRIRQDSLLRHAVLAGDERAWQTWYDATYEDLYRYVHWRSGGRRDWTDEVVQETWLSAIRRLRKFDPQRGSFLAWVRGIAANVLRNHLRRQAADRSLGPLGDEPSTDGSPEGEAMLRERAGRIAATLAAMPSQYEAVLRAKYLEEAPVGQIADSRGQTVKAVESMLSRARRSFRHEYRKLEGNGHPNEPLT